ncbi:MAG TPA: hypothetical protein VFE58_12740 [Tepidisphaeraceae bacterium]|jgi:tetratricopeptide (TPR) repeat protein|nr:hypothetical protein [Tepidisphaeraceae bacterium]
MNRRRGLLIVVATAIGLVGMTAALMAKSGVVKTREGQVYEGDVEDNNADDFVTVTVRGIKTQIARADVESIVDGQAIDAEYKQRLAKLDAKDSKGRMALARWAFDQKRYDLARDAANQALMVDPNSAEATQFLTLVQSQQRIERARARAASAPTTREAGKGVVVNRVDWQLLKGADINRIRQEELRKTDARVRFRFANDVERRFLATNRNYTLADWRAMSQLQRAIKILDEGDSALRDDIIVESDPASIMEYRRLVQPIMLGTCATAGCHGGLSAGPLVLNTMAETNEAATYTNFYILEKYAERLRMADNTQSAFGGDVQRRMLDRLHPEDSLLLQYALPLNAARMPHPDVQGFRAALPRGRSDTKYQALVQWIGTTLAPIEPNYGIEYEPPAGAGGKTTETASTTRPSRQR